VRICVEVANDDKAELLTAASESLRRLLCAVKQRRRYLLVDQDAAYVQIVSSGISAAREWAPTGKTAFFSGCKKVVFFASILPYARRKRNRFPTELDGLPIFSGIQPKFVPTFWQMR
jgi:hypothetical protein